MASAAFPAWQTGELEEEWVESSPSPPRASIRKPSTQASSENLPPQTAESIRLKRGSLRALGHSAPRALPPSRNASVNSASSPRVVSGHGEGRVLSEKLSNGLSDLPSPPSSQPGSDGEAAVGTFLVKDGVDDDRGAHLAKKGRDMFGPTALEKMFRPPSPVAPAQSTLPSPPPLQQSTSPTSSPPTSSSVLPSTTPTGPPSAAARRLSHPYAPLNPSRLSKSVTPSSASSSFNGTNLQEEDKTQDVAVPYADLSHDSLIANEQPDDESDVEGSPARELKSGEVETDMSPLGTDEKYPFTFAAPRQAPKPVTASSSRSTEFASSPFHSGEASHSTLHKIPQGSVRPGLRLFRGAYDTYTREHLSALVDSIAIEASPSPPITSPTNMRQWSSDSSRSRGQTDRTSEESRAESQDLEENDSRSSKRMRMSPVSPARQAPGVRDWGAQGRAMMARLRAMEDSTTSASQSHSAGSRTASEPSERGQSEPSVDYNNIPRSPPKLTRQNLDSNRATHRSNPSTTSSGYLRRAEELMARIRAQSVSVSSTPSENQSATTDSRIPSGTSSEWGIAGIAAQQVRSKAEATKVPRRRLERSGAEQENERSEELYGENEAPARKERLEERRPISAASGSGGLGQPEAEPRAVDQEDLNRFVSATTAVTSTTMSTSFVKHAGPRAPTAMRVIKPDDLAGIVPDRVGRMRYDPDLNRWVKDCAGLHTVDERGESADARTRSRSAESEDVFAGMESWGSRTRPRGVMMESTPVEAQEQLEELAEGTSDSDSSGNDEHVIHHADTTHIIEAGSSVSDESGDELFDTQQGPRPSPALPTFPSPPPRPQPHHAESAPAVMTPVQPHLSLPRPIRSALRNANSLTPAVIKKTQWHESVTPAGLSREDRRSVSFSDGKKNGRIRGLHPGQGDTTAESDMTEGPSRRHPAESKLNNVDSNRDGDWFRGSGEGERSWQPSARTRRIENMFEKLGDLSIDEGTPSKPPQPRPTAGTLVTSPEQVTDIHANEEHSDDDDDDADRTVRPLSDRSLRTRGQDANATYLTECSFGVAHDKLVQVITDVYGSEPYWEGLKTIDLRGKAVDSVARMKEFLPDLEEVNLADNKISYLSGMPSSMRVMHIANNRLSSLSSFDHLRTLTFLDVSNNNLDEVSQLACLTNLREVKLDGNIIKSLAGIMQLENLVRVSAKRNKIANVDLTGATWPKLETLDLSNNRISKISGLSSLTGLREIVLDMNRLTILSSTATLPSLRTIRISDNDVTALDLCNFPKLRILYADRNRLNGLRRTGGGKSRIENLSLRNQTGETLRLRWTELQSVKRLYLSGNPLVEDFFPSEPLSQLTYLEVAACSLTTWPTGLSRRIPKLEILNANYNYFYDINGLRGLTSLRKLSVVGSKLGEGGRGAVMTGLKGLSELEEVDLRMNPSTLGFYLPLILPSSSTSPPTHSTDDFAFHQNPLPNVTLATIRPPDTPAPKSHHPRASTSQPSEVEWNVLDAQFRRSLPDEWYSKRLVYRGLIMASCPALSMLDGVKVEEGERRKAGMLLAAAGAAAA